MYKDYLETISGPKPRARYKQFNKNLNQYFSHPIIHKEINGDKIYVALDLDRIWNRIN